ncbi:MAG: SCO family protein [Solirubrobacteraceae bacterium]
MSASHAPSAGRWLRATMVALAAMVVLAGCGGSTSRVARHGPGAPSRPALAGLRPAHPQPVPPTVLRDSLGHLVSLAGYRGKAVLVTFIYTHCPDTCPLIAAGLHNALGLLGGKARLVRVVAVSTDPRGDTRASVSHFLTAHDLTGKMEYLLGTRAELTPVWRGWGISASAPTANDRVGHSALVYGISGSGVVRAIYPANFRPSMIAHDVPILAAL